MTSGCEQRCLTSPLLSINYDQPDLTIVAASLVFVIVATMFCNLLVGFVLLRFRSLRNVSNLLIGNLALSDFLLSVAVLPLSAVNECLGHWVFGRTACNVWLLVDVLFCTASIWNLCLIAFDRFTATFYPLWYRGQGRANWHHALAYTAIVWTIAAAACLPPLVNWNDLSVNYVAERVESSQLNVVDSCPVPVIYRCVLFRSPSYVLYSASVSFYVPCLVTFFLYINILVELRRRRSKTEASKHRSPDQHQLQQHCQPAVTPDASPATDRWNRDRDCVPASGDDGRAAVTSAVVTWMIDRDDNEPASTPSVDVDDQHLSNDSLPTSPTHPLSRHSPDGQTTPPLDDDVIHAPAPTDVTGDLQQLNELTPRRSLLPVSNSDTAVHTSARLSVAETFIHRVSSYAHR